MEIEAIDILRILPQWSLLASTYFHIIFPDNGELVKDHFYSYNHTEFVNESAVSSDHILAFLFDF